MCAGRAGTPSYTHAPMPTYEYRCTKGHTFEAFQSISDDPLTKCEVCGRPVVRVLHSPAVHFKGSGFYNTDYGTKKRQREKASSESSSRRSSRGRARARATSSESSGSSDDPKAPRSPRRSPRPRCLSAAQEARNRATSASFADWVIVRPCSPSGRVTAPVG